MANFTDNNAALQGVCKDCGNGALNNETNPAFEWVPCNDDDEVIVCNQCGSQHLDLL